MEAAQLALDFGLSEAPFLKSLGWEWDLGHSGPDCRPTQAKLMTRIQQTEERLLRLWHLPARPEIKGTAIVVACFSLFAYAPPVSFSPLSPLRSLVRRALGHMHGSPEVIFSLFSSLSLDPYFHWLVALAKLWFHVAQYVEGREIIRDANKKGRCSALSSFLRECDRLGWTVSEEEIDADGVLLRRTNTWFAVRKLFAKQYMKSVWKKLAARRPLYHGVEECDTRAHRRLLRTLPPYACAIAVRMWAGAAMTRSHKFTLDMEESDQCSCGMGRQDVRHLLYHCSHYPPPSPPVLAWSRRPPAFSSALL